MTLNNLNEFKIIVKNVVKLEGGRGRGLSPAAEKGLH